MDDQVPVQQREGGTREGVPSSEIQRLQEQNAGLRNAVSQMRREMEMLSGHLPSAQAEEGSEADPDPKAGGDSAPPGEQGEMETKNYVLALKAETQSLKHKIEALEEQLQAMEAPVKMASTTAAPRLGVPSSAEAAGQQVFLSTDAGLTDQASGTLALRKLGDRVQLLNLLVTQLKKKVRHKPLELVTVQQELPSDVDQVHLEVSELQKQVAELKKHLRMVPPRADPAYRKQLQREGLADGRPIGTENQTDSPSFPQEEEQPPETISVPHLQRKLKVATRKILSLRLEREQLLEMGNRLRAELGHPKGKQTPSSLPPTSEPQNPREVPEIPLDRAPPLGQLQPHSTIQKQHRVPTETWKSVCQKENRSPKLPQAQEVPEESDHHPHRSSSLASSSLQDTWKLLDLGSSVSGVPSQGDSATECPAPPGASCFRKVSRSPGPTHRAFAVKGLKMEPQPKATHPRPGKSHPAKPTNCQRQRHSRVRNYNLKD
ncbi:coiled-coil domain-containing protein 57 [Acomys russatus]|uniref:coiled-coil domain-containing protein 57 n=1 Tax=Acomys russatus TaxID=60746 RepID=UPI0021E245C4|nr:coiled-coil domain-containing protein 57 [Acomys russatus]